MCGFHRRTSGPLALLGARRRPVPVWRTRAVGAPRAVGQGASPRSRSTAASEPPRWEVRGLLVSFHDVPSIRVTTRLPHRLSPACGSIFNSVNVLVDKVSNLKILSLALT